MRESPINRLCPLTPLYRRRVGRAVHLLGQGTCSPLKWSRCNDLTHPRVEFMIASSADDAFVERARAAAADTDGPGMVILALDHGEAHVTGELDALAPLVTPGSLLLVQDGTIDLTVIFRDTPPGPLPAIERFLEHHPELVSQRAPRSGF